MKRFLITLLCLLGIAAVSEAQDISSLEKIGRVTSVSKNEQGVILNCQDKSQVALTVLASDLIRVRASFNKPLPARDHSWAIAKENWSTPLWSLNETADSIIISTAEVEVVIHRSPLLIDFRDARTHALLNSDEQPMAYDTKGCWRE